MKVLKEICPNVISDYFEGWDYISFSLHFAIPSSFTCIMKKMTKIYFKENKSKRSQRMLYLLEDVKVVPTQQAF